MRPISRWAGARRRASPRSRDKQEVVIPQLSLFVKLMIMLGSFIPGPIRAMVATSIAFCDTLLSSFRVTYPPLPVSSEQESIDIKYRTTLHTRKSQLRHIFKKNRGKRLLKPFTPQLSLVKRLQWVTEMVLPERLRETLMRMFTKGLKWQNDCFYTNIPSKRKKIFVNTLLSQLPMENNSRVRGIMLSMAFALREFWIDLESEWEKIKAAIFSCLQNKSLSPGWQRGKAFGLLYAIMMERVSSSGRNSAEDRRLVVRSYLDAVRQSETTGPPLLDFEMDNMLAYISYNISNDTIDLLIDDIYGLDHFIRMLCNDHPTNIHDSLSECITWCILTTGTDRTRIMVRYWTRLESVFERISSTMLFHLVDDVVIVKKMIESPSLVARVLEQIRGPVGNSMDYAIVAAAMLRDANREQREDLLGQGFLNCARHHSHHLHVGLDPVPIFRSLLSMFPAWICKFKQLNEGGRRMNRTTIFAQSLPDRPAGHKIHYDVHEFNEGTI